MKPKSIINHNTVIPKNTARYREEFDMISLPKANQYKITSITCKIDTTSLWNIRTDNTFKMVNNSNQSWAINGKPHALLCGKTRQKYCRI